MLVEGTKLQGRYRIVRTLGLGGMGAVYLAQDMRLANKLVAVKEMIPDPRASLAEQVQAQQQFQWEASTLASLDHPNLPRLSDYFTQGGRHYLVMDYVDGETLEDILKRTPGFLLESQVVNWATQLCDVLTYLHSRQPPVVCRDLKPSNIMVDRTGMVKLIDFGIARIFDPGKKTDTLRMGTMGYAPPEQYEGKGQTDARSDIYSMGATLYHLLTNVAPPDVHQRMLNPTVLVPPRQHNPPLSENTEQVVLRAMEVYPNQRYQTAVEMKQALLGTIIPVGPPSSQPAVPTVTPIPLVSKIHCPSCGAANRAEARFCNSCATPLRGTTRQTGMLQPNAILAGRYIIVRKVGGGGMGAIYQATDQRIQGKLWAIKEMSDAAITNPLDKQQAVDAFRQEAQLLAILHHGNLPKVSDYFTEGGKHHLVMDFVQGRTLEQVLHSAAGFLVEDEVVGWAIELCDVLTYLHSRQPPVIFRDLKPANIMLDTEGRIKLVDFGIARLFQPGKGKDTQIMGTPGYAAPEQYGAGQTDARSDIYALGVTLHQLLTRYDPSLTPFSLPRARNINLNLSPAVEAVIVKATHTDVAARFHTVKQMRQALLGRTPVSVAPRQAVPAHFAPPEEPEMIRVPAGEFLMGSDEHDNSAYAQAKPQHRVYLEEYWIGKYPVTNAQYAAFVDATGHKRPWWVEEFLPREIEDHPVVYVSWHDAVAYCRWLSQVSGKPYRLPTEAEWEKAARGTDGRIYPWGNRWDPKRCNSAEGNLGGTTPVGAYPQGASPYGLLDMTGNVCELCQDWRDDDYYASSPLRDPQGPRSGEFRIGRGGSWRHEEWWIRAAARNGFRPDIRGDDIGFRCASQSP